MSENFHERRSYRTSATNFDMLGDTIISTMWCHTGIWILCTPYRQQKKQRLHDRISKSHPYSEKSETDRKSETSLTPRYAECKSTLPFYFNFNGKKENGETSLMK